MEQEWRKTNERLNKDISEVSAGQFFYLVAAIVLGLSFQEALLISFQQTGWDALSYTWALAGILLGVCLLYFLFFTAVRWNKTHEKMMN
jgi:hypothetical protein